MIGGGLFIYLAGSVGWRTGLSVMAAAVVLMAIPVLLLRNRKKCSRVISLHVPSTLMQFLLM